MSIFRREEPAPAKPVQTPKKAAASPPRREAEPSRDATRIAPGSKVEGQIVGNAELVIEGQVHGEILLDSRVVVGEKGLVDGTISARSVEISGKVIGNVQGTERVEVKISGSLEGDVAAPKIEIASGAFVQGKIDMKAKVDLKKPSRQKNKESKKGDGHRHGGPSSGGHHPGDKSQHKAGGPGGGGQDASRQPPHQGGAERKSP